MKRIVTLLLAAGLVLGAAAGSQAADIKAKGTWEFGFEFSDRTFQKHDGEDTFKAQQRLRTQIDVIASESLKGVVFLEMGHTNWGNAKQGGALGTDGKEVEVRYSYVDWVIPQTDAKVRMGLQPFALPDFTVGNPILGGGNAQGAGVIVSGDFSENVGASLFWLRAENDNVGSWEDAKGGMHRFSDEMDFIGLTVPLTFDGVKVTPWAMYGSIGRDSFPTAGYNADNYPTYNNNKPWNNSRGASMAAGVALIWAAAATYFYHNNGMGENNAAVVVDSITKEWLGTVGGILAVLGVIAAPITSGDTAFRSARLIVADFLHLEQRSVSKRLVICIPLFLVAIALLLYSQKDKDGFDMIWRYFAWSNQTLAVFTLWALTVYLVISKKPYIVTLIPALFMTAVCSTYIFVAPEGLGMENGISQIIGFAITIVVLAFFLVWKKKTGNI